MKKNYLNQIEDVIKQNGLLYPLDVLFVGATGTGKSSTINMIFGSEVAKVGNGVNPETQIISPYLVSEYFRIHDSAGLGDGRTADLEHSKNITTILSQLVNGTHGFIDLVIVMLDGGSRDLGTVFRLLDSVIIKNIEPERIVVCINQADMAMKGRNWNCSLSKPEPMLLEFLEEQSKTIKQRIYDSTGLNISKPTYYSAYHNYNLDALCEHIIKAIPNRRRIIK